MTTPSKAQARMVPADQPETYKAPISDTPAAFPLSEVAWLDDGIAPVDDHATYVPMDRHAARPATPTAPATPAVGAGTSGGAAGPQIGVHEFGLGDAIRAIADFPDEFRMLDALQPLADRADALEQEAQHIDCAPLETARLASDAANRNHEVSEKRLQAIERVRGLHHADDDGDCWADGDPWPCLTIRALDGTQ